MKAKGIKITMDQVEMPHAFGGTMIFTDVEFSAKLVEMKADEVDLSNISNGYTQVPFSLHFTTKDQSLASIKKKFDKWMRLDTTIFNGIMRVPILNHCFLTREDVVLKELKTDVVDYLDSIVPPENQIHWATTNDMDINRRRMLTQLAKENGTAIFVGDIIDGVKIEYDMAQELGVECVVIKEIKQ